MFGIWALLDTGTYIYIYLNENPYSSFAQAAHTIHSQRLTSTFIFTVGFLLSVKFRTKSVRYLRISFASDSTMNTDCLEASAIVFILSCWMGGRFVDVFVLEPYVSTS